MKSLFIGFIVFFFTACSSSKKIHLPHRSSSSERMGGKAFFEKVASWGWKQRDSLAVKEILAGNIPGFLRKFIPVNTQIKDSTGKLHKAFFYVSPDYISIGTGKDFARVPLTPMAAQLIADSFNCFLPTKKMVDIIYGQAKVKLEPVPMFAYRDSAVTMWQHHLIIEGQRRGRQGLIAGIKKDIVTSIKMFNEPKQDRVAIYGWQLPGGKPIQPLYTGHVNWYTDYSHGARLVYRKIKIDGREMDYESVLIHTLFHKLLSDEGMGVFKYPY